MKGKIKKLTAVILSLALLGSAGLFTGLTAFADVPATYEEITVDQTIDVGMDNNSTPAYFRFVPAVSGQYRFFSSSADAEEYNTDPYGFLLDSDGN
ncbi:MAG: hypothetical protein IKY00_06070, partial [Clostridia bacterium]|nr:hypothetical protein [Clostridia bacterium]